METIKAKEHVTNGTTNASRIPVVWAIRPIKNGKRTTDKPVESEIRDIAMVESDLGRARAAEVPSWLVPDIPMPKIISETTATTGAPLRCVDSIMHKIPTSPMKMPTIIRRTVEKR